MKLSFSINSKSKPKPKPTSLPKPESADPDDASASASTVPQFVTEFDPTKPISSKPDKLVIAPIPNTDYIRRFKPTLPLPSAEDDPSQFCAEASFVLDTNASAEPSGLPYGLSVRSDNEKEDVSREEDNGYARKRAERAENRILKSYKEDMQTLPDNGGPEEFKGTELGDLAAALLRGYGWTEGKALGCNKNREDTKIVDYKKRSGTYGIGFNPTGSDPKKNRRGEWVVTDSGAQEKREKDNGKEREKERNSSRRGEDLERERASSRKRKEENGNKKEDRVSSRRNEEEVEGESKSSKRRREEKYEEEGRESSRKKERESKREEYKETKVVRWLKSHIRVRIISKDFKRGKYYLQKGEVVDVVGPTTCDITMDGTRELLQGIEQDMLETALPKKGGAVLVLYGKHEGVFGNLVSKDSERETGVVRDADSHELVNVQLEQIAEYLGDPTDLGY